MPTLQHSIGPFAFLTMTPVPPIRRKRLTIETRPGADGYSVWLDGTRGEIWRPETVIDIASHSLGQTLKAQYEAACGSNPLPVVYAGRLYANAIIKDVQVRITDQLMGVGGFSSPFSRALVRATWDILIL
jgi:hypothetical protein